MKNTNNMRLFGILNSLIPGNFQKIIPEDKVFEYMDVILKKYMLNKKEIDYEKINNIRILKELQNTDLTLYSLETFLGKHIQVVELIRTDKENEHYFYFSGNKYMVREIGWTGYAIKKIKL